MTSYNLPRELLGLPVAAKMARVASYRKRSRAMKVMLEDSEKDAGGIFVMSVAVRLHSLSMIYDFMASELESSMGAKLQ